MTPARARSPYISGTRRHKPVTGLFATPDGPLTTTGLLQRARRNIIKARSPHMTGIGKDVLLGWAADDIGKVLALSSEEDAHANGGSAS